MQRSVRSAYKEAKVDKRNNNKLHFPKASSLQTRTKVCLYVAYRSASCSSASPCRSRERQPLLLMFRRRLPIRPRQQKTRYGYSFCRERLVSAQTDPRWRQEAKMPRDRSSGTWSRASTVAWLGMQTTTRKSVYKTLTLKSPRCDIYRQGRAYASPPISSACGEYGCGWYVLPS
jgi:hypothetical protein